MSVSVEEVEPPWEGMRETGLKTVETLFGVVPIQAPDNVTSELKPLIEVTVIMESCCVVPLSGMLRLSEVGFAVT